MVLHPDQCLRWIHTNTGRANLGYLYLSRVVFISVLCQHQSSCICFNYLLSYRGFLVCLGKPVCMWCVCACENQPWAIMKVTYVRVWTSHVCDVKLSCPQKRPYSYLEHIRRWANVRDMLSLQHLPYYWLICSSQFCHVTNYLGM